jgi:16S rRNA (uracil1498-N3)-methyltransferase
VSAPVFIAAAALLADAMSGSLLRLSGPEGRHAATVQRLRSGEAIELVDGGGTRVHGRVAGVAGREDLDIEVLSVSLEPEPPVVVTVVQALLKGDRMESALEMLTEVGVDRVVPWAAARCIAQWRPDRAARSTARLSDAIAAAGKQSRRARFPELAPLAGTPDVATLLAAADLAVVLHEAGKERLGQLRPPERGSIVLVVGPEGGVAPEELAAFAAVGGRATRMGATVQRAATAGTAAAAVLLARCGRWG